MALDMVDNVKRAQNAIPLAAHCIFRPLSQFEPIGRNDIISDRKFEAEETPRENQIVLGWLIDTRSLRVYLPVDKAAHWTAESDSDRHFYNYLTYFARSNEVLFITVYLLPFSPELLQKWVFPLMIHSVISCSCKFK